MTANKRAETKRLSILYLIYGFRIGGAERHLLDLCKGLDQNRFRPEIIYFHRDEEMLPDFLAAGIPCTLFPVKGRELTFLETLSLAGVIRSKSPDIVHVHLYHASRYGTMAAFLAGKRGRILRTKHNVREPGRPYGKRDRLWETILLPLMLSRTVAVSEAIARQIGTRYVVYNGVDTARFDPTLIQEEARARGSRESGLTEGPKVGIVGRLTRQKGHRFLLEAFARVVGNHPHAVLLIAGDGEERTDLEELARGLNLGSRVRFLGAIRNVREFLATLDLFVHPSLWEGLGISAIEAMSMALPIVGTNVDGLSELITDGHEGLLVEPGDPRALSEAMERLLTDRPMAVRLGWQARQRAVKYFSLKTMIERYEQIYVDLAR